MSKYLSALVFVTLASVAACSADDGSTPATSDDDLSSGRNQDVQVLKVYDAPGFSLSRGSIYQSLDQEDCKPEGKTWNEIKQHDTTTSGYLSVKLDCTDAFTKKYALPTMRAVNAVGSRTRKTEEQYYGYVGFSNGAGGYFVKTVELVVKQSVIDAPSFHGIGFYLNAFHFRYYQAPPPPGADNGNAYFLFADQVRAQADRYPAATLASGEQARVIKVLLPSESATGGSSSVPAYYFRPFAEFIDSGEKHQRWDSVASEYFVRYNTEFNREGDILQH